MSDSRIRGYRLSPQQRRVWRLQQAESAWRYEARAEISIHGSMEVERLREALKRVVESHEILRSVFVSVPGLGVPLQGVQEAAEMLWREEDVRGLGEPKKQEKWASLKGEVEGRKWDWKRGPLLAVQVVRVEEQEYQVRVQAPVVCVDEAGMRNLIGAWEESYADLEEGGGDKGGAEGEQDGGVQYAAVAEWLNENLEDESAEAGRQFWRQQEGIGERGVNLPWKKQGERSTGAGVSGRVTVELGEELKRGLGKKASEQG